MTHESPQPEREGKPEKGYLFNVGKMTDEQIYATWHALITVEHPVRADLEVIGELADQLTSSVSTLADHDPERLQNMVRSYIDSGVETRRELAATITPALFECNYEFTRDVLIELAAGEGAVRSDDFGKTMADFYARLFMRDRLTSEQVADWQARYAQHNPDPDDGDFGPYGPDWPPRD